MVFSSEFKQAANDDWGATGDAPFVYGVVGHDLDSGGVDKSSGNTCCQCYQSFNTAAGGGKNFDVYMATGGEGANTAGCTAMYDNYPSIGQPNNGGIRVIGYTTTTMQDCCRPTCGWAANVTQSGSTVDASYGAFYTCDKAGNPS